MPKKPVYQVDNIVDYRQYINRLTPDELNNHAIKVGVVPFEPHFMLKNDLEEAFKMAAPGVKASHLELVEEDNDEEDEITVLKAEDAPDKPVCAWRRLLAKMLDEGASYGTIYPTSELETALGVTRDQPRFCFSLHNIRQTLMNQGMYLTSRGQKGEAFVILSASQNADVMESYSRRASEMLKCGITLGANTVRSSMNGEEQRRHDSILDKLAHKSVLMKRSERVWSVLDATPETKKLVEIQHAELTEGGV